MEYKFQFCGPTGTDGTVETALKLARMVKGRSNVIAFTNAFHGMTMGSMSATANQFYRESFINRTDVTFVPFDSYFGDEVDTAGYLRQLLEDKSSGLDLPAAIIMETVQAEGGVNVASGASQNREAMRIRYITYR